MSVNYVDLIVVSTLNSGLVFYVVVLCVSVKLFSCGQNILNGQLF